MQETYNALEVAVKVDPNKQLKPSQFVSFEYGEKTGLRVMFVGNSITKHGILPEIGWENAWGMAASAMEKDYVHLCYEHIRKQDPDATFCICQAARWERNYKTGHEVLEQFEAARAFAANVIIIKLGANSPKENFDEDLYEQEFGALLNYLDGTGKAKVVVATEFYTHPAERPIITFAQKRGYPICMLSDLGDQDEMKALGLFWHEGVANHPGDLGMRTIANRICAVLDSYMHWK